MRRNISSHQLTWRENTAAVPDSAAGCSPGSPVGWWWWWWSAISFFRGSSRTASTFQGGAGHNLRGSSAHFLLLLKSNGLYQRKTVFSLTNRFTISLILISFEPFFPKRMFHFIFSDVFISVCVHVNLFYQRIKNSGPHA